MKAEVASTTSHEALTCHGPQGLKPSQSSRELNPPDGRRAFPLFLPAARTEASVFQKAPRNWSDAVSETPWGFSADLGFK